MINCYFTRCILHFFIRLSSLFCPIKFVNFVCFCDVTYLPNNDQSRIFNCLYIFPKYCHANVSAYFNDWSYVFTNHVSGRSSSRLVRSTLFSTSICPFCESSQSQLLQTWNCFACRYRSSYFLDFSDTTAYLRDTTERVVILSYGKQSYETQVEAFSAQPFSFVTILLQTNQLPSPL